MPNQMFCGVLVVSFIVFLNGTSHADLRVTHSTVEFQANPIGIDNPKPHIQWTLESNRNSDRQSAFEIQCTTSESALSGPKPDLWVSGRIATTNQSIIYAGKPLSPRLDVRYRLRVWNGRGNPSAWSREFKFETGMMGQPWAAKWIATAKPTLTPYDENPAPLLRKPFQLPDGVKRARAYVTGLGYYDLRINGKPAADYVLDPGWTAYDKRIPYRTLDVTPLLQRGENCLGLSLGNGWYNPLPLRLFGRFNLRDILPVGQPCALLRLDVELLSGRKVIVVTDRSWEWADGPLLRNNIYLGETYDARREVAGWDSHGKVSGNWHPVTELTKTPGPVESAMSPPVVIGRTFPSKRVTKIGTAYVVDMGQNFAGWAGFRLTEPAGTKVRFTYGELIHPDGSLNPMTSVTGQIKRKGAGGPGAPDVAVQSDTYICKGIPGETYRPQFTWHGFRYVLIEGVSKSPQVSDVTGYALHARVINESTFECSEPILNEIQAMCRRTFLSNIFSVQSDCPHRERLGYGGDIVASSEAMMMNFDMTGFYRKAIQDLADAQRPNGGMTETAPFVGIADAGLGDGSGPVEWGTAFPLLVMQLRQYYGDSRLDRQAFEPLKKWIALLIRSAKDGILVNGIGDHESLTPKPIGVTGTAFYIWNLRLASGIAKRCGAIAEAKQWAELAISAEVAFRNQFVKASGKVDTGVQTAQTTALYLNLLNEDQKPSVISELEWDLATHGGGLTTGIFGTKFLWSVLEDADKGDTAWKVATRKAFPGFGYMLDHGATTLWEHWEYSDNTFSHNHPMFGSVSEWMFQRLAGIRPSPDAVGFDHLILKPAIERLASCAATYRSVKGPIKVKWDRQNNSTRLQVSIPVGCRAELILPRASITMDPGIDPYSLTTSDASAKIMLLSGKYMFTIHTEGTR